MKSLYWGIHFLALILSVHVGAQTPDKAAFAEPPAATATDHVPAPIEPAATAVDRSPQEHTPPAEPATPKPELTAGQPLPVSPEEMKAASPKPSVSGINAFEIVQVHSRRNQVIIKVDHGHGLTNGSELVATFLNQKQCTLKVVQLRAAVGLVDANDCPIDELKKGQLLEKSMIGEFQLEQPGRLESMVEALPELDPLDGVDELAQYEYIDESFFLPWYNHETPVEAPEQEVIRHFSPAMPSVVSSPSRGINPDLYALNWQAARTQKVGAGLLKRPNTVRVFTPSYSYSRIFKLAPSVVTISSMHFLGPKPNTGLFMRTDLDISRTMIEVMAPRGRQVDEGIYGLGVMAGSGYAMPVSAGKFLLFQVNYSTRPAAKSEAGAWGLSTGLRF